MQYDIYLTQYQTIKQKVAKINSISGTMKRSNVVCVTTCVQGSSLFIFITDNSKSEWYMFV